MSYTSAMGRGCVYVLVAAGVFAASAARADDDRTDSFVGSKRELALVGGALLGSALLEYRPPNDTYPLIGGEQKPYVGQERVPDWLLGSAHLTAAAAIRFVPSGSTEERDRHLHGYVVAASLNAFGTSLVKGIVGRKRPSHESAGALGLSAKSRSFYSGHASNGFMLATYASLYARGRANSLLVRTAVPLALYGAAAYTAWSRVAEHRHYVSDVVTGAAAGTLISALVFRRYDGMVPDAGNVVLVPSFGRLAIFVSFR